MNPLIDLYQEVERCVRCGACRPVCPTFSVIQREMASPRGRVSLCESFTEGAIELSPKFIRAIRECITCAACRENCPNSVDLPSIILTVRNEIFKEKGLPFHHLLLNRILASRFAGFLAFKGASIFQGLLFKGLREESGLHTRFPLPFLDKERLIPPLAGRTFLERRGSKDKRQKAKDENEDKRRRFNRQSSIVNRKSLRVGLFVGCLVNYITPRIGEATLNLLKRGGFEVVVPIEQLCCGIPALNMGDRETAKRLAMKNLEVFSNLDLDFIVTPCATCATSLKLHFKELLKGEDEEVRKKVEGFSLKVKEITEFLAGKTQNSKPKTQNLKPKITYHDPCHMSRYLKVKDEPRELIEGAGYKFVEMSHPCRCCGFGGVFSIDNYTLSKEIGKAKALDIVETSADIVATACPGCIIQLKDALHHLGVKKRVLHVVELLELQVSSNNLHTSR